MLQHWANEGKFYTGGFVLPTFIGPVRLTLNELAQYKTTYVELAFTRPMLSHFVVIILLSMCSTLSSASAFIETQTCTTGPIQKLLLLTSVTGNPANGASPVDNSSAAMPVLYISDLLV